MIDNYVYIITALLPLAASMLVFQTNPYHALVIRGILGAIAALVYTVLGAADVALTEALVGTLLAITLYAVAVRSSLVLRLGVLQEAITLDEVAGDAQPGHFSQLMQDLQTVFGKRHMRVELVPYLDISNLRKALMDKEVHATCTRTESQAYDTTGYESEMQPFHTITRLQRLYEIMQTELVSSTTHLTYINPSDFRESQP
jgi:putative multicomponent Na+:H+ antiporter subunit B